MDIEIPGTRQTGDDAQLWRETLATLRQIRDELRAINAQLGR